MTASPPPETPSSAAADLARRADRAETTEEVREVARELITGGLITELADEVRGLAGEVRGFAGTIEDLADAWSQQLDDRVDDIRKERRRVIFAVVTFTVLAVLLLETIRSDLIVDMIRERDVAPLEDRLRRLERLADDYITEDLIPEDPTDQENSNP